jgi:hypothetical protein
MICSASFKVAVVINSVARVTGKEDLKKEELKEMTQEEERVCI